MPKKRKYQTQYSKPPSVAPPSLSLSSSSSQRPADSHGRSVNELLAGLRRSTLNADNAHHAAFLPQSTPSVPPPLRAILQIPDAPAPPPRRPLRRTLLGRRPPPGPPPPRSWLAPSRAAPAPGAPTDPVASVAPNCPLPGAYYPEPRSFVDVVLRHMALDWHTQRDWNRFYLYTLPGSMRAALLHYASMLHDAGVSSTDLRLVLAGPSEAELAEYGLEKPDAERLNNDIYHLDLSGSAGKGLSLKSFADMLVTAPDEASEVQESWEIPTAPLGGPIRLLPNLTHLSLAVPPNPSRAASWKQLLSLAHKLPTLTHLCLAGWPAPSTTPNAMLAKVVSPTTGRATNYAGTSAYSHVLDDDWSEAVLLLRKLSKALYSLEYLDLTGCGDWFPALRKEADAEVTMVSVDWAGDWGKVTTLKLGSGYAAEPGATSQLERLWDWKRQATVVEKRIRAQRAGRGRFITVKTDDLEPLP